MGERCTFQANCNRWKQLEIALSGVGAVRPYLGSARRRRAIHVRLELVRNVILEAKAAEIEIYHLPADRYLRRNHQD